MELSSEELVERALVLFSDAERESSREKQRRKKKWREERERVFESSSFFLLDCALHFLLPSSKRENKNSLSFLPPTQRIALSLLSLAQRTHTHAGNKDPMQRPRRSYPRGGGGGAGNSNNNSCAAMGEEASASTTTSISPSSRPPPPMPNLSRLLASASPVVALRGAERSFSLSDVW
jgi:hypothetical protein